MGSITFWSKIVRVKLVKYLYMTNTNTSCYTRTVNQTFCSATAPACANSNALTPVRTIGAVNYYTCANGYSSSGGATSPYFNCTSTGWTSVINSCVGMLEWLTSLILKCALWPIFILFLWAYCTENPTYCSAATPPTTANANTPTPNTQYLNNVRFDLFSKWFI